MSATVSSCTGHHRTVLGHSGPLRGLHPGHSLGLGTLGGTPAAWLDISFFSPEAKRRLYQRQIMALPAPGTMVMLTLTSERPGLDEHARTFGSTAKG